MKAARATISLDTNWDPEERWAGGLQDLLPYVDVFFPKQNEILAITDEKSVEAAVAILLKTVPVIALKRGKQGATTYMSANKYEGRSLEVPLVDSIVAGDNFDAGFLAGYLHKKSWEECTRMGCICGSLSVRRAGGTKCQPLLGELCDYL